MNIHVCKNKHLIQSFRFHEFIVLIVDKVRFTISKLSIIQFFIVLSNEKIIETFTLSMYYMLDSSANLLSISTLEKQNIY